MGKFKGKSAKRLCPAKNWFETIRSGFILLHPNSLGLAGIILKTVWREAKQFISLYGCTILFSRAKEVPTGTEFFFEDLKIFQVPELAHLKFDKKKYPL